MAAHHRQLLPAEWHNGTDAQPSLAPCIHCSSFLAPPRDGTKPPAFGAALLMQTCPTALASWLCQVLTPLLFLSLMPFRFSLQTAALSRRFPPPHQPKISWEQAAVSGSFIHKAPSRDSHRGSSRVLRAQVGEELAPPVHSCCQACPPSPVPYTLPCQMSAALWHLPGQPGSHCLLLPERPPWEQGQSGTSAELLPSGPAQPEGLRALGQ